MACAGAHRGRQRCEQRCIEASANKAAERARRGEGPTLLECKTYRWRGHHEGDPNQGGRYRSKEDIQAWVENCPIKRLEQHLSKNKIMSKKQMQAVWDEVELEINASIEFAEQSPFPPLSEMYQDVLPRGGLEK